MINNSIIFYMGILLPWGVLKRSATKAEWKQKPNIFLWQGKDCNWRGARHRRKTRWSLERDRQKWRGKNAQAKTYTCITRTTSPQADKKISYRHTKKYTATAHDVMENKAVLTSLIKPYKKILTFPAHATILKENWTLKPKELHLTHVRHKKKWPSPHITPQVRLKRPNPNNPFSCHSVKL